MASGYLSKAECHAGPGGVRLTGVFPAECQCWGELLTSSASVQAALALLLRRTAGLQPSTKHRETWRRRGLSAASMKNGGCVAPLHFLFSQIPITRPKFDERAPRIGNCVRCSLGRPPVLSRSIATKYLAWRGVIRN